MAEILEIIMIVSFGASWPMNVMKSYKARTAKGKSLGSGDAPVKAVRECALELGVTMVVESETLTPTGIEEVGRCMDFLTSLEA